MAAATPCKARRTRNTNGLLTVMSRVSCVVIKVFGESTSLQKDNTILITATAPIPMMKTHPADQRSARRPADS